jgi:anti-sigma factor RsiW
MITCADLEEFVADYLDGSLAEPRRRALETHLDDCAACREFVAAYQRTVRVAKKVFDDKSATAEAPENLVQAILVSLAR